MDCLGLASVQATTSGLIDVKAKDPALRGNRLSDGEPLTVYLVKHARLRTGILGQRVQLRTSISYE